MLELEGRSRNNLCSMICCQYCCSANNNWLKPCWNYEGEAGTIHAVRYVASFVIEQTIVTTGYVGIIRRKYKQFMQGHMLALLFLIQQLLAQAVLELLGGRMNNLCVNICCQYCS